MHDAFKHAHPNFRRAEQFFQHEFPRPARALTAADLGLESASLTKLAGSVIEAGATRVVQVNDIAGVISPALIRPALNTMLTNARGAGVQVLQIEARLANPGLSSLLPKLAERFGGTFSSIGGQETMTFILGAAR